MAQLMVRHVDEAVVCELKKRAARRNHSAEQIAATALICSLTVVTRNAAYERTGVAVLNPFT